MEIVHSALVLIIAAGMAGTAAQEVACVVPEGKTDPQFLYSNIEKEPVGGRICNKTGGEPVQDYYDRCEKRYCCFAKCSCVDPQTLLLHEHITTCPAVYPIREPVVYNCYVTNHHTRYYRKVCCDGYTMNEDYICVREVDCDVNNGGCAGECVTLDGRDTCQCDDGYTLTNGTECTDINECLNSTCGIHECVNINGSFKCDCLEGYRWNGQSCEDVDECLEDSHTCEGTCHNLIGSYNCSCPTGYTLESSGACTDVDECLEDSHTCEGTCHNLAGTYKCSCPTGYTLESSGACTAHPTSALGPLPEHSRQESPGGPPPYVYVLAGLASLIVLILLLLLLLLLRRRRRAKKLNHSASGQNIQTDAFANVLYGMTTPQPMPEGAVGGHHYEELPEVVKKKKDDDDMGEEAAPLPDKVPLDGATGGNDDGHYEVLQDMDKIKLNDDLGVEYSKDSGHTNYGYEVPTPQVVYDVPKKY